MKCLSVEQGAIINICVTVFSNDDKVNKNKLKNEMLVC